ncbi:GNAT family N-acetyltransferase [bacterium]|nr:GNAT family N-acetyltransferase [bacterium]
MTRSAIARVTDIMLAAEPWKSYGFSGEQIRSFIEGCVNARVARVVVRDDGDEPPPLWHTGVDPAAVVGVVVVQPGFLGGRFLEILALDADVRGRGLGRAIIDAIGRESPLQVRDLFVLVAESNAPARAFYERLGFRPVGPLPGLIREDRDEILIWLRFR